jgi:hypothetical protein
VISEPVFQLILPLFVIFVLLFDFLLKHLYFLYFLFFFEFELFLCLGQLVVLSLDGMNLFIVDSKLVLGHILHLPIFVLVLLDECVQIVLFDGDHFLQLAGHFLHFLKLFI